MPRIELPQTDLNKPMLKRYRRKQVFLAAGVGLAALTLGTATSMLTVSGLLTKVPLVGQWFSPKEEIPATLNLSQNQNSAVLPLVALPAAERAAKLEAIAKGGASLDRNRARYLLAADLIQQNHGGQALSWLDGLERDYTAMAAQVLVKRAQAYESMGDAAKAEATWKALLQQYPKDPAAAEALFNLGRANPQYWDQAIAQFPAHPRSIEIALARLEKNPNQPQLLLLVARHGLYLKDIVSVLDRLKKEYAQQLTPEDWQAIAFGYWEKQYYGSAGAAYAKAPPSAINLYRSGRGAQLGDRASDAVNAYQVVTQAFPNEPESGLALLKLADLAEQPEAAIPYLDQVIQRFPDKAPEALLAKSKVLQKLDSTDSALQARQSVLSQYSKSNTAAEIRWEQAEQQAKAGNFKQAWEWARQVANENPDSDYAPEAAFWVGKWATQLGQQKEAQTAFQYVLSRYPESYYAWRSAVFLGWDVGDFSTVRQKLPKVVKSGQRSTPLAGSTAVQELYQLGQDRDAWTLWQVEFTNRIKPTVAEQFTDGLLRLGVNENLDGIFMLSSLSWREPAAEKSEYKAIKEQTGYWQALYPFPFLESIEQWSQQRQLNPLLVTALIRQESRFEPAIQSSAGALGLMQIMPDTADWVAEKNNLKDYNLEDPNDNIKLGTWYLDFTHQEYANNSLFAVASYNAGPGSVADWISQFGTSDPDQFVEQIPYPETKGYVESVFGNYWNYLRLYNPDVSQQLAKYSSEHSALAGSLAK
jgi:soluble lytic murein transglycosylase